MISSKPIYRLKAPPPNITVRVSFSTFDFGRDRNIQSITITQLPNFIFYIYIYTHTHLHPHTQFLPVVFIVDVL